MTLIAKPSLQETRGSQRIIHCQVYERILEDGDPIRQHRPELDFDVVLAAVAPDEEVQLAIAQRLQQISPPVEPLPERPLPAVMTTDAAAAFVAAKKAADEAKALEALLKAPQGEEEAA